MKSQNKFEDAVRDLQLLYKEQPEKHIKTELETCLKLFTEQRKKQAEEASKKAEETKKKAEAPIETKI